jgi:hypothetical protein
VTVTIVGVYRRRNAEHVRRLLQPALEQGWAIGWWALDEVDPSLRELTLGKGPGLKLPLLSETMRRLGSESSWTVISDDDLVFRKGDVVRFVRLCERAGIDLAQPARARGTQLSHGITVQVRCSRARRTSFIESGPLFAVGPRYRDRILPLPGDRGMGWGVEIDWYDLAHDGCRLGIVDNIVMEHLGETATDYDDAEIRHRMLEELVRHGHPKWDGMRNTFEVWRPWQWRPPWRGVVR